MPNFRFPAFLWEFHPALVNEHLFLLVWHFPLAPSHGLRVWTGLSKIMSTLHFVVASGIGNSRCPCLTSPQLEGLVWLKRGSHFPAKVELTAKADRIDNPNREFMFKPLFKVCVIMNQLQTSNEAYLSNIPRVYIPLLFEMLKSIMSGYEVNPSKVKLSYFPVNVSTKSIMQSILL